MIHLTTDPILIAIPPAIAEKITGGSFTGNDLINEQSTLRSLSDSDILDLLAINDSLKFTDVNILLNTLSGGDRINRLNIVRLGDNPREITMEGPGDRRVLTSGDALPARTLKVVRADHNTHLLLLDHHFKSELGGAPLDVSRTIAGRYGFRHMACVNRGLLYKELTTTLDNPNRLQLLFNL